MPSFGMNNTIDFLKKYRWDIQLITPHTDISIEYMYVKSVSFPSITIGLEDAKGASLTYHFAKEAKFSDVDIVFYETVNTYEQLLRWQNNVYDFDKGVINVAQQYMGKVIIMQLNNDLSSIYKIILHNAFPIALKSDALDYATDGVKLITMTISYSHYTYE